MIDQVLASRLRADEALLTLVGDRFYPVPLPQRVELPAVRVRRITTTPDAMAHDGPLGVLDVRFELAAYAASRIEAREVAAALRSALGGWSDLTQGVHICRVVRDQDVYIEEPQRFRSDIDVKIQHEV